MRAGFVLLFLLTACSSTSTEPEPAELTPVSELPEDYRELLHAYGRGGPEWAALREDVLRDPPRARFMAENLVLEMYRAYDQAELSRLGEERGPFERARDELVHFGEPATPILVDLLSAKDGIVPVVASDVLARIGSPAVLPVLEVLEQGDARARRAAAELLGRLPHAGAGEDDVQRRLAVALTDDAEWLVRAQVARSLGSRGSAHRTTEVAREGLQPGLADDDSAVARESAAALGALGDPESVPALINFLERTERRDDPRGHEAAQDALRKLTGEKAWKKSREWRDFWRDHRKELLDPPAGGPY